MLYWKIALLFGVVSFIAMMFSWVVYETDYDLGDATSYVSVRLGAAVVVGVAWPLALLAAIAFSCHSVIVSNEEINRDTQ